MSYAAWCRDLFDSLSEGGLWGVPRSGLTFTKRNNALVLTAREPRHGEHSTLARMWQSYQQDDFEAIRDEFAKANIVVEEEQCER